MVASKQIKGGVASSQSRADMWVVISVMWRVTAGCNLANFSPLTNLGLVAPQSDCDTRNEPRGISLSWGRGHPPAWCPGWRWSDIPPSHHTCGGSWDVCFVLNLPTAFQDDWSQGQKDALGLDTSERKNKMKRIPKTEEPLRTVQNYKARNK